MAKFHCHVQDVLIKGSPVYGYSEHDEQCPESWETATPFRTPRRTWPDPSCSGSPLWNGIETYYIYIA